MSQAENIAFFFILILMNFDIKTALSQRAKQMKK